MLAGCKLATSRWPSGSCILSESEIFLNLQLMARKRTVDVEEVSPPKRIRSRPVSDDDNSDSAVEDDLDDEVDIHDTEEYSGLGTIKSVQLINFMCHSALKMDLGDKINFVTGQNGSGKSAILTALTVALGGRATFTNRANSISKLLKEGTDVGQVIVTIRNKGSDGFQPDVYGDFIIVERRIPREGTAGYKIKSASGKIISTRRQDLVSILDHLHIDVENPMTILTQDTARSFLANSTGQEKYAFFLKGTQLDRLMNDYKKLDDDFDSMSILISRKSEVSSM